MSHLRRPPHMFRALRALLPTLAAMTLMSPLGCGGYDDLPVRERAFAPMAVSATSAPSRLGPTTLELTISAPGSLTTDAFPRPWVIVGHPTIQSPGGRIIAWARGPCDSTQARPTATFVLCATVRWDDSDTPPESPVVKLVLEARASAQRVTFIGEIADPTASAEVSTP